VGDDRVSPAELIGSFRRRGVLIVPSRDGRLSYRPRQALSKADREYLARNRAAILALFESDPVGWRAAVMATQVSRAVALPLFLARPGVRFAPGSCCSCGDQLDRDERYRCHHCVAASVRVLEVVPTAGAPA
jgi:hypothetical protein